MCLIVHKPEGVKVPEIILKSGLQWNSDGAGVMSADGVTKSAKMSEDRLLSILDKIGDKECAVHMRMATHGRVNRGNTHPFRLANGGWLMHNGIFSNYASKNKFTFRSDTANFVDRFCNPRIRKTGTMTKAELEKVCGFDNRLAVMSPDGEITRYGSWTAYEGLQLSNTYAWDYPYDESAWTKYDGYKSSYELECDIGVVIIDTVYKLAPMMFSEGNDIPGMDPEDRERYQDMFMEGTDGDVFLAACSMTSIVAIYDALVRGGYL